MGSAEFCRVQTVPTEDGSPEPPSSKNLRTGHQLSPLPHISNLTSEAGACNTDREGPGGRIDEIHNTKAKNPTNKTGKPTVVLKSFSSRPPLRVNATGSEVQSKHRAGGRTQPRSYSWLQKCEWEGIPESTRTLSLAPSTARPLKPRPVGISASARHLYIYVHTNRAPPGRPRAHRKAASLVPIHMYTCALRSSRVGPAGS